MLKPTDLNDLENGKRIFIIGSSPQLNTLTAEQIYALEHEVTIGVNRVQYKVQPKYFLSAYPSEILLALKRASSSRIIHIRPTLQNLFSEDTKIITVKRDLFEPGVGLPRWLDSNEPTLFTKFNVALASTHLALILGAREIIYIGIEMKQVTPYAIHYYDVDPDILKCIFEDIKEIKDYPYLNIDHTYATYEYYLERLGRSISQLDYKPFRPENHADTFRIYFEILNNYGVNVISTTKDSVIYDAGGTYVPLSNLLGRNYIVNENYPKKPLDDDKNVLIKINEIKKEIIAELLHTRLTKAEISPEALISAFTNPNIPVSSLEIELLKDNAKKAKEDGADLLADTLEKLIDISIRSQSMEKIKQEKENNTSNNSISISNSPSIIHPKSETTQYQAVIIAGMHRSGTSMITQILQRAGLYLGKEDELLGPSPDNGKGHMENLQFLSLNEKILSKLGGGWDFPPPLVDGWENSSQLDPLRQEAEKIIKQFDHFPFWGWKDPRNTLLLPFWRTLLPGVKIIYCLRNPVEVAKSLHKRNYFSYPASMNLWLKYNHIFLRSNEASDYIITHYDAWFYHPTEELSRIIKSIGLKIPEEIIQNACHEISPGLRHDRSTFSHLIIEETPVDVVTTYWKLCQNAGQIYKEIFDQEILELDSDVVNELTNDANDDQPNLKYRFSNYIENLTNTPHTSTILNEDPAYQLITIQKQFNALTNSHKQLQDQYTNLTNEYEILKNDLTNINTEYDVLNRKYTHLFQEQQENYKRTIFSRELTYGLISFITNTFDVLYDNNQFLLVYKLIKDLLSQTLNISDVAYRLPMTYLSIIYSQKMGDEKLKAQLLEGLKQIKILYDNPNIQKSIQYFFNAIERNDKAITHAKNMLEMILHSENLIDKINTNIDLLSPEIVEVTRQKAIESSAYGDSEVVNDYLELANLLSEYINKKDTKKSSQDSHLIGENDYFTILLNTLYPNTDNENINKPLFIEPISPPRKYQVHTEPIAIIICVHNALEDVKRCLSSILHNSNEPYRLILVDDGSDISTQKYLMEFQQEHPCLLIRNDVARGYTRAANQGMRNSTEEFLILLNSDTIVTPGWLDGLYSTMVASDKNGIVSPLSNTASWQSIPKLTENGDWAINHLPDGIDVNTMSQLVAKYSGKLPIHVPLLNGFCLMIRREILDQIGYFNEDIFGDGYGEEDDFNLRAKEAGWQLAIADDVYIYHAQSKSYSNERRHQLAERAGFQLRKIHGDQVLNNNILVMNPNRVLEGIRARTNKMFEIEQCLKDGTEQFGGKKVLFILPVQNVGGGANVVIDEARCMRNMNVDVQLFNLDVFRSSFLQAYPHLDIPIIFAQQKELPVIANQFDAAIATANFSIEWLKPLEDQVLPVLGHYIQDFEPFMYEANSLEAKNALQAYKIIKNIKPFTKTKWTQMTVQKFTGVKAKNIGISVNINLFRPRDIRIFGEKPIKITAMIRMESKYRNPEMTLEILRRIKKEFQQNVALQIFGSVDIRYANHHIPLDFNFDQYGIINQLQVANLLSKSDIFVDFSTHQAMGLTALEAMACGCAVIVPQNGGAIEFIQDSFNGLIADTTRPEDCYQKLKTLVIDDVLRTNIQLHAIHDVTNYYPEKTAYNILSYLFNQENNPFQKKSMKRRKRR